MESIIARNSGEEKISLLDRFLYKVYKIGHTGAAAAGLNRSMLGRKVKASLNMVGALATRMLLSSGERRVTIRGQEMVLAGRRAPSPAFGLDMILGCYEAPVVGWFEEVVKPGMTVLDVGAHVGFYTLVAAKLVGPGGKVYAFEPEPENFAVLSGNVASGKYTNVELVHAAVTDKVGKTDLFISAQGNDRHSVYQNPATAVTESRIEVRTTSIDEFLRRQEWPRIDVIKMDVEGAEPIAVEGMTELLSRSKELKVLIEFAPELLNAAGRAPEQFLRRLAEIGFSLMSIEDNGSRRHLDEHGFSQFAAEVNGAVNLICEWKPGMVITKAFPSAGNQEQSAASRAGGL